MDLQAPLGGGMEGVLNEFIQMLKHSLGSGPLINR